jgi:CHAD domain-containing protein
MSKVEATRIYDNPANFVAELQALAVPAPHRSPPPVEQISNTRRLNAERLCASYHNENAHTEHVTRLALRLFDATHRWLGVPEADRPLLEAACRLHDVAYQLDPIHHRERSAEIAGREGLPGFTANQRACIAAVMLFHAGNWKDQPAVPRAMQLGAFLRIADGLDWGHVQDAKIVGVKKFRQSIRVNVSSDWFAGNLTRADQKADLWRKVFPLDVQFVLAKARRPRPIVEPGLHMLEIARRLLSVQYKTIVADVDGAVVGEDPEHLHRIRVAIRRLRSLLRVFRKCLPDTGSIDETLRQLGSALGPARDLDVWLAFLRSEEITAATQGNRRWREFVQYHEQVRQLQRPTVRRELGRARLNGLRRRMAKLLRTQLPVLLCAPTPVTLAELAAKKFLKELRGIRDLGELRHSASMEKLHRLRIALRRARYLGEFFGPVLGKRAGRLTRRVHQVEKPLAQIHDLDVGLSRIQHSGPSAPRVFAALLQARREHQQHTIELAWYRLVELEKQTRRELQAKLNRKTTRRPV